jgi:hypothetical protein
MTNAPAPIIGGMMAARIEAAASPRAAMCGGKPACFMCGMVMGPF